jgi:hypothetical protein
MDPLCPSLSLCLYIFFFHPPSPPLSLRRMKQNRFSSWTKRDRWLEGVGKKTCKHRRKGEATILCIAPSRELRFRSIIAACFAFFFLRAQVVQQHRRFVSSVFTCMQHQRANMQHILCICIRICTAWVTRVCVNTWMYATSAYKLCMCKHLNVCNISVQTCST